MIAIGRYSFEGPYPSPGYLRDESGVYVILHNSGGTYYVLDIGESGTVRTRVETHDRQGCWQRHATGPLAVAVLYAPWPARSFIEQELRGQFNPPCGDR